MKTKKIKKLALGTGKNGIVRNYIDSPSETMAENDIMMSKAKMTAADNGWAKGLDIFGNMAMQYGMSQAGGVSGVVKGVGKGFGNMGGTDVKAFGGKVEGKVEVEGGEVAKLPNGEVIEFEGPDHKDGGINVLRDLGFELPEGSDVYSKRVFNGESMAKRALEREKKTLSLEKLLESNSHDTVLKDTLKRTKANNTMEEQKDKRLQEMVRLITELGTNADKEGVKEFKEGGTVGGNLFRNLFGGTDPDSGAAVEGNFNMTGGDLMGMAGTIYSAFEPMKNTEKARAGDTPNINAFEDFGNDALDTIEDAKGYLGTQQDNALNNLEKERTSASTRNRKSARGVNQMRALDLATDSQVNDASIDVYDNFAKQMVGLLSKQAGFENERDTRVMTGEATRDDNDRKDRDNYFSQLAKDIATKGQGIQQLGKMTNESKQNTVSTNLLNQASKGYKVDSNGNVLLKNGKKELSAEESKAVLEKQAAELGKTYEEYVKMLIG